MCFKKLMAPTQMGQTTCVDRRPLPKWAMIQAVGDDTSSGSESGYSSSGYSSDSGSSDYSSSDYSSSGYSSSGYSSSGYSSSDSGSNLPDSTGALGGTDP